MDILPDAVDYGDAPSFVATGIRRVFFVSRHIIRVTFVRTDIDDDGIERQRVSGHVDMDVTNMRVMNAQIREALMNLTPPSAPKMPPPRLVAAS